MNTEYLSHEYLSHTWAPDKGNIAVDTAENESSKVRELDVQLVPLKNAAALLIELLVRSARERENSVEMGQSPVLPRPRVPVGRAKGRAARTCMYERCGES